MNTTKLFTFLVLFIASVMFLTLPVSAFEDNFDDGEFASDWTVVTGVWSVQAGGMPTGSNYSLYTSAAASDSHTITQDVSVSNPNYLSFWIKKIQSADIDRDSIYFSDTQFIQIDQVMGVTINQPVSGSVSMGSIQSDIWGRIEIIRSGDNFICIIYDSDNIEVSNIVISAEDVADTTEIKINKYTGVGGSHSAYYDDIKLLSVPPTTQNGIEWDLDQYTEGETASYSWNLQNSFWQDLIYKYRIQILKDGAEIDTVRVSQTGTRYQEVDTAGTYEVKLQYSGLIFTNWQTIDSDTVNVIPQVDSYINVPKTAPQKTNFTVNYLYGTAPPTAAIFVKKLDEQLEAYVPYDIVYLDGGTANTEYSQNMSIWGEGFYKLVLYNANVPEADLKTDVIQITKIIIPPQTRINTSRIRSQLDTYSISDMIWGDYAVDFTNYTSYIINLELYNYEYDAVVYSETVNDQCGVILIPLYDPDLTVFTGEHNVRLSSYSNTGVFVDDIVHDNFTINLVNPTGYGLTLSKYEVYSDETFVIKCIVPQPSTLKIINRLTLDEIDEFEVNASSYINYQISEIGNYEIRLIGASGYVEGNQYIKVVEGTIIDDPVDEDEIKEEDVAFSTKFESMLSSGAFVALLIIIACVGAFGKIGGVVGVFLGMVVGISISFLMGYLPAWILFIMVLALCVVFVSKLINSFGGGE